MIIKGTALKLMDDINTDYIIAGKYTKTLNMDDLASHVFEDLDPSIKNNIWGKVIVAGNNFGCGSSREQAPLAIKHAGATAVVAKSFARIFFRNAINIGLPVLIAETDNIRDGDELEIDLDSGKITNLVSGKILECSRLPSIMLEILQKGGLVEYLKEKGEFQIL
ncbi:MAG: 3-isopropylmalate dehydratase small subunit [Firmicutes bacterium]|jgi:3-isopropylmalate/(R)-2-methylmalate dehydratase small subunit|nr:3-isopropylmalate dehydratase small subunit [Bacillota bacterium]